tara:strand:- start:1142 stop:1687 length:546 start_codon:yes stop_codon:yes gene_type:complete
MNPETVVAPVRSWVDTFVVGMNLCPFAKRELAKNRVRFSPTAASTEAQLLDDLQAELELLQTDSSIETTLLIHPNVLQDFNDYNGFLDVADQLLVQMELEGLFQIASFHPDYQFDGVQVEDPENYTNRSPFPMLHIIREASLERAIADYPDVNDIPIRNIAMMNALGRDKLLALLESCFNN